MNPADHAKTETWPEYGLEDLFKHPNITELGGEGFGRSSRQGTVAYVSSSGVRRIHSQGLQAHSQSRRQGTTLSSTTTVSWNHERDLALKMETTYQQRSELLMMRVIHRGP